MSSLGSAVSIPGVTTFPLTKIIGMDHITFGAPVIIDDYVFIYATDEHVVGDYVHIASFTSITGGGRLYLGAFATVSSGVRILTGSDDFLGGGLTNSTIPDAYRAVERGVVRVDRHAIIGANAVLLPNVSVGEGCAVAAGAVVTKDLDPWGVYAGVPARRLRDRPCQAILENEERLRREMG